MQFQQQHQLIPFGKYKGQPIEALMADPGYAQWLMAQSWFQERFPQFYTLIIHQHGEPEETPEHNAMQLRFLDEGLRQKLASLVCVASERQQFYPLTVAVPRFEEYGYDVVYDVTGYAPAWFRESEQYTEGPPRYAYGERADLRTPQLFTLHGKRITSEHGVAWPVTSIRTFQWDTKVLQVRIECKPSLGDDYPAVLRAMQRRRGFGDLHGYDVLLAEQYAFRGGTVEQVTAFFAAVHVHLLLEDDVQHASVLAYRTRESLPQHVVMPFGSAYLEGVRS